MNKTDEIKNLLLFLLSAGNSIKEEQLLKMFTILADLSGISDEKDFDGSNINKTTLFAENSLKLFIDAETDEDYDCWIEYFREELEKIESYELLSELEL